MTKRDDELFGRSGGRNRGDRSRLQGDPERGSSFWNEGYRTSRFRDEEYGRGDRDARNFDENFDDSHEGYPGGGGYMGGDWSRDRGGSADRDRNDYSSGGGAYGPGDESDYGERGRFERGGGYMGGNYEGGRSGRGGGYMGGSYGGSMNRDDEFDMSGRGAMRGPSIERNDWTGGSSFSDYGNRSRANFSGMQDRGRNEMQGYGSPGSYSPTRGTEPPRESFRGRGPQGYSRSDDRIEDDLNRMLTDDHHVDATDIDVKVHSGEVTLTGFVNSRDEKRRAEDLAEGCFGVKEVTNQIRVRTQQEQSQMARGGSRQSSSSRSMQSSAGQDTAGNMTGTNATEPSSQKSKTDRNNR